MECGTTGATAEQLAERRSRRLLLNENPARESIDFNEISREVLLQGINSQFRVKSSPFPDLFQSLQHDPKKLLEVAWIVAVMELKLSSCVEIVNHLRLELAENAVKVDFVGTRHRKYSNVEPHIIRISGECQLQP